MKVRGKVIAVTGAGSGIGRSLTLELLGRGASVAAVDLNIESLQKLKAEVGTRKAKKVSIHQLDISDEKKVKLLPSSIIEAHGSVDGIINNAGIIQPFVRVNDLEINVSKKVFDINFYGTLFMVKAFLPELLERPEGYIANVSSMGGFLPVPGQSLYGASKAAVKLLTEGLYAELRDTNIGISVIFPGATETNISANSNVGTSVSQESDAAKSYKMLSPDDAAKIIVDGIEKGKLQIYTGKDSKFMNLLYRLSPKFATNYIAKQMSSLLK